MTSATTSDGPLPSVESNELRRVRRFGMAAATAIAVFLLLPSDIAGLWYLAFGWTCVVLVLRRAKALGGDLRRPITLVGLAGASSLASGIVREVHAAIAGVNAPFPSPADVLVLLSYGLFVAAILAVVHRRIPRLGPDPWLDAAVAGIAAAILQWTIVVIPYLQNEDMSEAAKYTNVVYSSFSLVLVIAAVLALVAGSVPSTSNRLMALGLVATFTADPVSLLVTYDRMPESASLVVVAVAISLGCAGSLHPSVRLLTAHPEDSTLAQRLTRRRIAVLVLALFTPPVLLLRAAVTGETGIELVLPAAASLALTPLVLVRLGRLVRENERLAATEQTLRSVGERLVLAESTADVAQVISVGLEQVLNDRFVDGTVVMDPLHSDGDEVEPEIRQRLRSLVTDSAFSTQLRTGQVHALDHDAPGSDVRWELGPVMVQRHLKAALLVATKGGLSQVERNAVISLCRETAIALRAVEQTEKTVRQRSEERFGSLIDNSSDIVAVLAPDGRLTYVSPVASRLLGYEIGKRAVAALDLVHPDDLEVATGMLDDVRFGNRSPVEVRLVAEGGKYHWFEVVGVDLQSDPNIRGIVLNARQIDDRKAAEERLRLSEARFKALVQNSSDVVLVVGSAGGIRYASPAVISTIGVEPDELTDRSLNEVFRDSGVDWDGALRGVRAPGEHPELLEFGFRNERGDWIHLEASVTDLRREEAVGGFVLNARDVTERTAMMQRLRYQSTHDALTGLPNRVLATEELGGMLDRNAGGSTVAIISLDIDDFKDINDSLGHGVGDRLLYSVAERIKESLAFGDVAARAGGDEFVVVLERAHGEAQVLELADRLLTSMEHPFDVDGRELSITASAGVAFDHDRETAAEVLLRNADTAMYRAKQLGKRQSVVFEPHMHTASFDRLELRADLVRAIETDQFMAHYQPIVDLETHRIVGCEALIRWQHPNRGLLSPAIFVPLAEETGLIGAMGEWMLERACRDLSGWRAEMPQVADALTISVNLTAQEVHGERLVPVVTDILRRTGLPADRLVLEVTESNLLSDTDVIQERMQRLRELGTRLAIDDFGTGYSSLGYIQRFAFDVLKIDRSFVEGLDRQTNRQIVTAVLDLARELGVRVVAEGIEEQDQEQALIDLGCKFAQGYRFSRPVPETAFRKLLVEQAVSVPS